MRVVAEHLVVSDDILDDCVASSLDSWIDVISWKGGRIMLYLTIGIQSDQCIYQVFKEKMDEWGLIESVFGCDCLEIDDAER